MKKTPYIFSSVFCIYNSLAQACLAQESAIATKKVGSDMLASSVSVFSNLIALIFVIFLLAWLYNRFGKTHLAKMLSGSKYSKKDMINILATSSLGQGKYLHIVETGGQKILIGSTSSNITMLKDIKEDIVYERVDYNE